MLRHLRALKRRARVHLRVFVSRTNMLRNVASRLTGAVARPLSSGSVASTRTIVTAKLPDLAYDYGALEPVICGEIMVGEASSFLVFFSFQGVFFSASFFCPHP